MNSVEAELDRALNQMVGLPVWESKIGHGSFLTIQFGEARPALGGYLQGEFHLWVFGALWQISEGTKVVAHSEDSRAIMQAAAQLLDGGAMQSFEFDRQRMLLTLRFGRFDLTIPPSAEDDMEEWMLFLDHGTVVTAGPGNLLVHESASSAVAPERGMGS